MNNINEDGDRPPPVPTFGNTGISLEAIGAYNITMFFLGFISIFFNGMEIYINISNKLYKISLYNCLRLYSNLGGAILAIRNILMSLINFSPLGNSPIMFSKNVCIIRGAVDIFIVHLFQLSYTLECVIFAISIIFPIFYMIYLDKVIIKKIIGISIVALSILPGSLLYVKDRSVPKALPRCIVYEIWTMSYHIYHSVFTSIATILLLMVFATTTWSMNKMHKKDEGTKKNVCSFIRWTLVFFLAFWSAPNIFMIVCKFYDLERDVRKSFLDLFYISVTISLIIPFPFALWKNKLVKKHFLEITFVTRVISKKSTSAIKESKKKIFVS
uniref:G_PROTEIN_RECEP_F1_2 domain-containing protein n=1 Tax=Parastrongyloides trichosuri TaxID=131310 RepID=A0A0N4ZPX5_PARTI